MAPRPCTLSRRLAVYRDALAVIEREFRGDVRLEDVAFAIGTSRRQLQRILAELAETTFRDLVSAVRLDNAAELLRISDLPIGLVARTVGYGATAHFTKAFRARHGVAPTGYRAQATADVRAQARAAARKRAPGPPGRSGGG